MTEATRSEGAGTRERDPAQARELAKVLRPTVPRLVSRCVTRHVSFTLLRLIFDLEVRGTGNVPATGPVLLCSNHVSNLDPVLIASTPIRYPRMMSKEELTKPPVFGWWIRSVGGFAVRRGSADRNAIQTAIECLRAGLPVLIFPEGTRSPDGKLQQAQAGFALLATAVADVPIVPVRIDGLYEGLPKGSALPRFRQKVTLTFGKAFRVGELADLPQEKKALYRALAAQTMRAIELAAP